MSTTTGSSCLPSTPPLAFCCSIRNSIVSLSVVSEIAIVPEREWRMPTLMVSSCAMTGVMGRKALAENAAASRALFALKDFIVFVPVEPLAPRHQGRRLGGDWDVLGLGPIRRLT